MKKIFSKLRSNGSSKEESDGGSISNVTEDEDDSILDERISELKRRIEESNKRLQFLQEKAQLYEFHQKLMKSADNALTTSSANSRSFSGKRVSKHRRINSTATGPQRRRDITHRTVSHMSLFCGAATPQNVNTARLSFEPPKDTAPDAGNTEDILSKLEEIKRERNKNKNKCDEIEKKTVLTKKGKKIQGNSSSPLSSQSQSSSSSSSSSSDSMASVRARKGTTAIFEEDRGELDFGDLSDIKISKKANCEIKIKSRKTANKNKGKGNAIPLNFGDLSGISLDGLQAPKAVPAASSTTKSSNNLDFGDLSGLNFEPSPSPSIVTKKPVKKERARSPSSKSPSLPLSSSLSSSSASSSSSSSPPSAPGKEPKSSSSASDSSSSSPSGKSMSTSSLTSSEYISSSSSSSSSISSGASSSASSSGAISISSSQSQPSSSAATSSSSSSSSAAEEEVNGGGEGQLRHQKRHTGTGRSHRHRHRHTESKSGTTNINDLLAQLDEKSKASKPDLGDLSSINLDDISMPPEPTKPALPRKKGKQKGTDARAKNNSEKVSAAGRDAADDDNINECEAAVADTPESEEGAHKGKRGFFDLSILDTLAKLSRRKKEEQRKRKIEKKKKEKVKRKEKEKTKEKGKETPIKTKSQLKSSSPEKEKIKEKEKEKEKEKMPAVLHYGVSEDANVAGLRRGKKKTTFNKGKGILSAKAHDLMDDAHIAITPFFGDASQALFGVFDGYAGPEAACAACKHLPLVLRSALRRGALRSPARGIKPTTWRSIYKKTDERLEGCECVGTTCTTVFCWAKGAARYLQAANVGDSLAFLCRAGKAVPLTVEHKVTNPSERKRLREVNPEITDKATRVNGIAVSRCLGSSFVKMDEKSGIVCTPDVSEVFKIGPEDSFAVVASDGLWDVMSGQEACNMIKDMNDAPAMSKKLIKAALKKKKCMDNVTVIVILLK